jgi:putative transposase
MPYRKTALQAGEYYHLYHRGNNRQLIFLEQDNYYFFLHRLKEYTKRLDVDVIAYCLMPTHFHLLIRPSLDNLSEMIRSLLISLRVTHLTVNLGEFGRARPVQTPPSSHQLRKS